MKNVPPIGGDDTTLYEDENTPMGVNGTFVSEQFFNSVLAELVPVELGGAANAYTATPAATGRLASTTGLIFWGYVGAGLGNTLSAVTLNYDGKGVKNVKRANGDSLNIGDLAPGVLHKFWDNGTEYRVVDLLSSGRPKPITPAIPTAMNPLTAITWTSIDCSSIVPEGVDVIILELKATETVSGDDTITVTVRQDSGGKGLTSHRLIAGNPSSGLVTHDGQIHVFLDSSRCFEAMLNNTGEQVIGTVLAYYP